MLDSQVLERFSCSGCGECCRWNGAVLLAESDAARLANHLDISEQDFIDRHTRLAPNRRQLALLDQADGSCAFLDGNRCSVYEARPEQCRTFPYAWSVAEGCPEIDKLVADQKNIDQRPEKP